MGVQDGYTRVEIIYARSNPLNCRWKPAVESEANSVGYEWYALFVVCAVPGFGVAVLSFYVGEVASACTLGIVGSILWVIGVLGIFPPIRMLIHSYPVRGTFA